MRRIIGMSLVSLFFVLSCGPSPCECYVIFTSEIDKKDYPKGVSVNVRERVKPGHCIKKYETAVPDYYRGTEQYYEIMQEHLSELCRKRNDIHLR